MIAGGLWGFSAGFYMGWAVGSLYEHPDDEQALRDALQEQRPREHPRDIAVRRGFKSLARIVAAAFPLVVASTGSITTALSGVDPLEGMAVYGGSTVLGEASGY